MLAPHVVNRIGDLSAMAHYFSAKERIVGDGYAPGEPSVASGLIDARSCLRCRCDRCRRRGLYAQHFTNNAGGYRVLGCCPHCGFAQEF